jgi:PIN domain nuclease of toxin-antitoxin system
MRLLLDTHVFVWALSLPHRLPGHIAQLMSNPENNIHVSAASIWEIAIKRPLGRMGAPSMSSSDAVELCQESGFGILAISAIHAMAVESLPLLHADPFDRLIVAQALTEPMRLITHDRQLAAYSDTIIAW